MSHIQAPLTLPKHPELLHHLYFDSTVVNCFFPEGHKEYNRGWRLIAIDGTRNRKKYGIETDKYITWTDNIKPILRLLSSMTKDEYEAIKLQLSVDVVMSISSPLLTWKDKPRHIIVLENRLQTNTLLFNDGMVLLRAGYDLLGLIPAGLAIDSTTLNPQH